MNVDVILILSDCRLVVVASTQHCRVTVAISGKCIAGLGIDQSGPGTSHQSLASGPDLMRANVHVSTQ